MSESSGSVSRCSEFWINNIVIVLSHFPIQLKNEEAELIREIPALRKRIGELLDHDSSDSDDGRDDERMPVFEAFRKVGVRSLGVRPFVFRHALVVMAIFCVYLARGSEFLCEKTRHFIFTFYFLLFTLYFLFCL